MMLKVLTIIAILCLANSAWGYATISGDTRVIQGEEDDPFTYNTTLPGTYTKLEVGMFTVTISKGNCSTVFFNCTYKQDNDTQATVTMNGYMSRGLKWVYFTGANNLIPITIVFLNNYIWSDLQSDSIQPQYSLPLIVRAKGMHTVSITCAIFSTGPSLKLYINKGKAEYYSTSDKVSNYPQILNFEKREILLHTVVTVTVKQNQPIDYYSCNSGKWWLTHTIDWSKLLP
ncbi:hypothetical protein Aperf_G00000088767 [Anoplocephala perfoliata]